MIDSSVIVAMYKGEADAEGIRGRLDAAEVLHLSANTLVEISMVVAGRSGEPGLFWLANLLEELNVSIIAFTEAQAHIAIEAFLRFGKGRHPAKLNYGDCFSYALAMSLDEPLLFLGNDFSQTDVKTA